jgi:DNA mismatch repair protein MutS2
MLYPKNIEEKIGFDKIRELIKAECSSSLGADFVDKMRFSSHFDTIKKLLGQTDEFQRILVKGEDFPHTPFFDISESLKKAVILANWLEPEEFDEILRTLVTLEAIITFFNKAQPEDFPFLREVVGKITFDKKLISDIHRVIDEKGQVRNNASPELQQIRKNLFNQEFILRKKVEDLLKSYKQQGFSKDDAEPTIREGRIVLPVQAEYKRTVKGFVHDTSATGQTVFMEPEQIAHLNNEIKELILAERQEIIKILTSLTDKLRPHTETLEKANTIMGVLDFIRAKARFAVAQEASVTHLQNYPVVEWWNVSHPILLHHFAKQGKKVVPQNIRLDEKNRILLISGPNAGGKSVTLKTIGLVQYMLQTGIPVPMLAHSKTGIFKGIFIDIGDEQSLDDDLSTYSSHLNNMKYFLKNSNTQTLCLIDEFGGGTEPQVGAAIAEAILEQLNQQRTFAAITTHYGNLKYFADRTEGIINGAMRYDVENLMPLYQLEIGQPGSSFALEIAQKIGLPMQIIANARNKMGVEQVSIEKLLRDLEKEKKEFYEKNRRLTLKEKKLEETTAKYQALKEELDAKRKDLMAKAKEDAAGLLKGANRKIENTIRLIKENNADKELTKQLRESLETFKEQIIPKEKETKQLPKPEEEGYELAEGEIQIGSYVQIANSGAIGKVIEINKKDAVVLIGELKSNVKMSRLTRLTKKEYKNAKNKDKEADDFIVAKPYKGINLVSKQAHFSQQLDLRGKRAEETTAIVDSFMDEAIMLGHHELKILHGKGNGVLRDLVRRHLRANYPEIAQMTDEHADRGGAGITVVTLKT